MATSDQLVLSPHGGERVRYDLDELTDEDRAQIREAVALVRRSLGVSMGMPRVRQPLPDLRPERTG
ncbi:hypothetical protein [Streptomyces sp. NBC_00280]|uniref:hypothetical protein n=1 Tax=Streptomyces sp. NBC_00280 TaxID=2975699 RepID=UPI003247A90C